MVEELELGDQMKPIETYPRNMEGVDVVVLHPALHYTLVAQENPPVDHPGQFLG